jgi:DNA-binding PadR family transcriptional regulator
MSSLRSISSETTISENSVGATITTTEGAVLGLLAARERSGYDLAKLAEQSLAYLWTPSQSQIYKVLPRLAASGFARVRAVEQRGRPDKALYKITAEGLEALRAWLDDVEEEPAGGRVVFALKLFLCDFASPGTAVAHLSAYRRFLERRLDSYEQIGTRLTDSPPGYPEHVLRHGLTRVRATLAWIDETTAAIESKVGSASQSTAQHSKGRKRDD